MRTPAICGLLLVLLSLNSAAIDPVKIGGEFGQDALTMIAYNPFTLNALDKSDLWSWGGSPVGYGQLFRGQGQSSDFGGWAPFEETPLGFALNETPWADDINKTKETLSSQGQIGEAEYWSTGGADQTEDEQKEPAKLFSSQGFFSGYGDWEPSI